MRVLMTDLAVLNGKKSGVGYYTQELRRALCRLAGEELIYSFPTRWLIRRQDWMYARHKWLNGQSRRCVELSQRPGLLALLEKAFRGRLAAGVWAVFPPHAPSPFQKAIRKSGATLYHEPNFVPHDLGMPTVLSVHDLSALRFPEWHPPERVRYFERGFHAGLQFANRLIAISEFGKQEIVKHLGWPAERVSVTYMGVRPGLHPLEGEELARGLRRLKLDPDYLLHVGTLEPRKNLMTLLRAYCALPGAVREKHPLVLAGGPGWNAEDIHSYIRDHAKSKNIRWLGYVKDELSGALYSGARALAFPTHYEGFGMPTIEMMACGGAVLASTAGAVAETVGGQAHLLDPKDEAGWRDAMLRVCTDRDWWLSLRRGAEDVARRYTWDACAEQTLTAYRLTLGEGSRPLRRAA